MLTSADSSIRRRQRSERKTPAPPVWVVAVIVVGALLMALGAILATIQPSLLVSPHGGINGAVRIYAGYLTTRNLALAIMLLAMLVLRAIGPLHTLLVLTSVIQIADALMDASEARWAVVPGVLVLGVLFFCAATRLRGAAFWHRRAWQD